MKKVLLSLIIFFIIFEFTGCSRDEIVTPNAEVISSKGAYVLCEGGFSAGTSMLSFYNKTTDSLYNNIFNPGSLGLLPDGMILEQNSLYIIEQGNFGSPGKLYRTDTNGTQQASVNVGTNPYSLTAAFSKLFITNGPSNNVSIVDKNTFAFVGNVGVGIYPQEILAIGNNVFVCNTSEFGGGTDSTVTVIDAATNAVTATIQVRKTPSALAISKDGKLLVGCPGDSVTAAIFKIDPLTFNKIDSFTNLKHGFSKEISVLSSQFILYIGGDVYAEAGIIKYDLTNRISSEIIPKPTTGLNYCLAANNEENVIYVGYLPNFSASGKLQIYNLSGTLQKNLTIFGGVAPRRIVVKR
ncbi:MAG TPA: YncE family protein [Ignavibacteria bacterium]|nr:YncE family protein [Ignavibacteria bacterium]